MTCSADPVPNGVERRESIGEAAAALTDYTQNDEACSHTCPAGQMRTCGNVCVTPVATYGACSPYDCASNSVCAHATASCRLSGGTYKCLPDYDLNDPSGGLTILDDCSDEPSGCRANLFCRDYGACFPEADVEWGRRCVTGAPQDGYCDSNWASPSCSPCMPHSTCWNGVCHVDCSTDADCPCNAAGGSTDYKCVDHLCNTCRSLGQACGEHTACCDAAASCAPTASGITGCCRAQGGACASDGECCASADGTERCLSGGACGQCIAGGAICTADHDCCSGDCNETTGRCTTPACPNNANPCPITGSGLVGKCAIGHIECNGLGVPSCHQDYSPNQLTESCNGADDDCDGHTDEGLGDLSSCSTATPAGCQYGFVTTGTNQCLKGTVVCVAIEAIDYCKAGGCGSPGCGLCTGQPCGSDSECPPNAACINDYNDEDENSYCFSVDPNTNDSVCPSIMPPSCYTTADLGTCL